MTQDQEREAFESEFSDRVLTKDELGHYLLDHTQNKWIGWQARAAIAQQAATAAVPAGFVLVPVEPTAEILGALWAYKSDSLHDCYHAMLAAAPAAPQPAQADQAPAPAPATETRLYRAAINCPHSIERDRIVLEFDPKQPGHNALNQLGRRLDAAVAAQAPAPAPETDDKPKSTAYERDLELLIHDFVRCSLVGTPSEATLHQLDRLIELVTHPIINRNLKSMRRQVTNPLPPCPPFASRRPSGAEIEAHEVQAVPQPEAQPYERSKAISEGTRNAAADTYFAARAWMMDTAANRRLFEAGFDRGWGAAPSAQAEHTPHCASRGGTGAECDCEAQAEQADEAHAVVDELAARERAVAEKCAAICADLEAGYKEVRDQLGEPVVGCVYSHLADGAEVCAAEIRERFGIDSDSKPPVQGSSNG